MDLPGVALIITAAGSFLTAVTTALIAVPQSTMSTKLDKTHELVNGMSHELQDADKRAAYGEGEKFGIASEREHPMVPREPSI